MTKFLIRAGFNPTINYKPTDFLRKNLVGDNLGNMLFAYGAMNALWTEDTIIEQLYDKPIYTEKDIEYINTFDAFVLPMADAFRISYIPQLRSYISLIKKLHIPVIVLGIGFRTSYEPQFNISSDLDKIAKEFVSVVLDHSACIGLRGGITGDYLRKLGFKDGKDYIPIGCPSLYTYGNNITTKEVLEYERLKQGKLIFNANSRAQNLFGEYVGGVNSFILNSIKEIPNHYLIQQLTTEFREIYLGKLYTNKVKVDSILPTYEMQDMLKMGKVKCFLDVPSWIAFCKEADLFIGDRFHGAVSAILAGTPHIFLPFDGRTRELSEFHHITKINPISLSKDSCLHNNIDRLDCYSFTKYHRRNFDNYISFLNKNGIHHIFKKELNYKFGESPMEKRIRKPIETIQSMESLSMIGKVNRVIQYSPYVIKKVVAYISDKCQ